MSDIQTQLFEAEDVRLGPIDFDKDPEVESKWTHDSDFMRNYDTQPARPLSAAMVKKSYEKIEKEMNDSNGKYYFAVRGSQDDRLIGKAIVQGINWPNGYCAIQIGIGAPEDRRKGYGTQALQMLVRFVFAELNLFRIAANVPEYNAGAIALLKKLNFVEEVRRRQGLERDGKRWDLLTFGLLKDDWVKQAEA